MIIWFWEISNTTAPGGRVINPEALGKTVWKDLTIFENVVWKRFFRILFWKQFSEINEWFIFLNNFEILCWKCFSNIFWKTFLEIVFEKLFWKRFWKRSFWKCLTLFWKRFWKLFFENFLRTDCFNNYNINFVKLMFLKNVFETCFGKRFWKSFTETFFVNVLNL